MGDGYVIRWWIALCFLAMAVTRSFAQVDIGTISGTVVDGTDSVVPGVRITVQNEGNRTTQVTTTNSSGYYVFPSLMVGDYTVIVEMKGFQKFVQTGIRLNAADHLSLPVLLSLGEVAQSVQVSGDAPQALALEPSTGGTVTSSQMQQLEVNGRNPVYLAGLEPGVTGTNIGTFDPDSVSSGAFSINGARTDAYTVYVDGAVATRTRSSGSMLGAQDMSSVQELQVLTGYFDAEYGRSNGGQIRFVTKSGTNKYHGEAYEVVRNAVFDANTWSRNASPLAQQSSKPPKQNYNDFGFTFGGPVYIPNKFNTDKSKMFFFVAEEWVKRRYDTEATGTVPTAAMRTGDLSELLSPTNRFFGKARVATDPSTGQPFPNNVIRADRLSSLGVALLNEYPLPTPGFQRGSANWIQTFAVSSNLNKTTFKVDYLPNSKNHLYVRGTIIPWTFNGPLEGTFGVFQSLWSRPNRTATIDLTTTFSATLVNDFSISGNSDGKGTIEPDPRCGAYCNRSAYGINYPYLYPRTKLLDSKLPTLAVTGLTTIDNGPYPGSWAGFVYDLADNVTKVWGNHTIKFGGVVERAGQNDHIQLTTASAPQTTNQNGQFRFLDTGGANTSGLGIANVLLGNFNDYSEFGAKPQTPWVANSFELFAQDIWQVRRKLTLHYGLRYSLWPTWYTTNGTIAQFEPTFYDPTQAATVDPKTGYITAGSPYNGIVLPGSGPSSSALKQFPFLSQPQYQAMYHNLPGGFAPTQWGLFQPRVGIAYQITRNTVVRSGGGYFADRTAINRDTALGGNPPFMPQTTLINGNVANLSGAASAVLPFTMTVQSLTNIWPGTWQYNAIVEREFARGVTVSAGFVGNRGLHLQRKRNINQILTPGTTYANPSVNPNALRPYLGAGIIDISENSGLSKYDSFQATVRKITGALTFGTSYTYSRSLDNTSSLTDVLPNSYSDANYWGPSDFSVPQALTISYTYNLPMHSGGAFTKMVIGGWAISGINQFDSGMPFSVRTNIDYAGIGSGGGNQFWIVSGNPNGCSTPFAGIGATVYCKNAFTAPAQGTFAPGDTRNMFSNPGFWQWNFAAYKSFPLRESLHFQFRAEAFNLTNHPNWATVNSNPLSSTFMMVTSKLGSRNLQFETRLTF